MHNRRSLGWQRMLVVLVLLLGTTGVCHGITVNLKAGASTLTMPDGLVVPVWGFALDNGPITVPGPTLIVPPGDNNLTVNVTNELPVPVSVVIPGLSLPSNNTGPVWTNWPQETEIFTGSRPAGNATARVRSFVHEAPAKVGATPGTATYTWDNVTPGAFLYQSGTNPAAQVQAGLYGMVKKDAAPLQAYGPETAYDEEVLLVFSAIDPDMNEAITSGNFGPGKQITNTKSYDPKYHLINGKGWPDPGLSPLNICSPIAPNARVLLRFANAGYETFSPMVLGPYLSLRAEDGHPYANFKNQYAVELAAGKTIDAWFQAGAGTYPIFDRRLNTTNAGAANPGGMIAHLTVGPLPADTAGPVVSALSITPNPTAGATSLTLNATADDTSRGCGNIADAEYWLDRAVPIATTVVTKITGTFDSPIEALTATVSAAGLAVGNHTVYVRSRDAAGNWGPTASYAFRVAPAPDVVTITLTRRVSNRYVEVIAKSSSTTVVIMTAQGFGRLVYRAATKDYRGLFLKLVPPPTVTVVSSKGGSDTKPIPYP